MQEFRNVSRKSVRDRYAQCRELIHRCRKISEGRGESSIAVG